jgi:mRNA-degrading endonuclease RelE of RelBE toxin-antitoxin system
MTKPQYEIVVTAPAARAIREKLPEAVAFAVIDFITGPLPVNPRRVGAALRNELEGVWSARRGTYGILYRDEDRREVVILRVWASQQHLQIAVTRPIMEVPRLSTRRNARFCNRIGSVQVGRQAT